MGLFKSLFGGNNTPETEKEKNDKKNFEILKYDGIRAQRTVPHYSRRWPTRT